MRLLHRTILLCVTQSDDVKEKISASPQPSDERSSLAFGVKPRWSCASRCSVIHIRFIVSKSVVSLHLNSFLRTISFDNSVLLCAARSPFSPIYCKLGRGKAAIRNELPVTRVWCKRGLWFMIEKRFLVIIQNTREETVISVIPRSGCAFQSGVCMVTARVTKKNWRTGYTYCSNLMETSRKRLNQIFQVRCESQYAWDILYESDPSRRGWMLTYFLRLENFDERKKKCSVEMKMMEPH